jgi:anti-sigma regulatory factor (Ser/Thr protein kinase)
MGVNDEAAVDVKFCLAFQREALSIPVMRRVLGDIMRTLGVDHDSVSDILLAATEACSNVLRHGGPRATGYGVVVTIGAARCEVEVEVAEDWGGPAARSAGNARWAARPGGSRPPWPPHRLTGREGGRRERHAAHRPPWRSGASAGGPVTGRSEMGRPARAPDAGDIAQLSESGRGLDVMRACVDDVTLRNRPGQGTVVIMRKRIDWASDAPLARMRAASEHRLSVLHDHGHFSASSSRSMGCLPLYSQP